MAVVDRWIGAHLDPHRKRGPLLVLASTRALAARIRRYIAECGGWFDVEVSTPRAFVHQNASRTIGPPEPSVAPALAARFADRPGLFALARSHVEAAAAARLAGVDLRNLPQAWREAADAGAGTPFERGLARVLAGRPGPVLLPGGVRFARVVAIGFGGPQPPWVAPVLERLGALPAPVAAPLPAPLTWTPAADPGAEARRTVGALLDADPDDALVLVHDRATAWRVRDALARNGVPCAWTDAGTLAAHPLAAAARQLARWLVAGPDPLLRAGEIEHWIGLAGLGRRLGDEAEAACAAAGGARRFDRRELVAALEASRLLEAPLGRWLGRLRALPDHPVAIRLSLALARIGEVPNELPGSIGAVRRVLLDLGIRFHDDPLARALLGAMRELSDVRADAVAIDDLLSRPLDARELGSGVEILTYDEYDGRPATRLVLLDLHDKGIARRTQPDPLLDEASLATVGIRSGLGAITGRLEQLRRAVSRAEHTLAVVVSRDGAGRPVVPPVGLHLAERPIADRTGPLPEAGRWDVLERRPGALPEVDDAPGPAAHLARQATLEWIRAGRAAPIPALAPWCGHAGEAGRLDLARPWSVTRLFRPLAHCPWQAFASVVLRAQVRAAVSEELDPAEVGTAVHRALEYAGPRLTWRPEPDRVDAAREDALRVLEAETARAFAERHGALGGLSPARTVAVDGGGERWAAHWRTWVPGRIRPAAGAPGTLAHESLDLQPAWREATQRIAALLPEVPTDAREQAVLRLARIRARGERPTPDDARGVHGDAELSADALPALRELWADPVLDRLARVMRDLEVRAAVLLDPVDAVHTEVPLDAVEVPLGPVRVTVNGQVDRVDRVGPWLRVVDYKTGGMPQPKVLREQLATGVEPQLVVYALALRAMPRPDGHPLAGTDVAAAGWDFLRDTLERDRREPKRAIQTDRLLLGDDLLDHAARALGARVADAADGRWPLAPDPRTCPALAAWGHDHCAFHGACRLRGAAP